MALISKTERHADRDEKVSANKLHAMQYLVVLVLAVLAAGMWRLQILGVDNYRVLAEANRVRKQPVTAPRGKIFDREGRILVDNYPSVSCFLLREQVKDLNADIPLMARGLDLPVEQIQATLRRYASSPKYEPIPLKLDITPDEQAFIEAHRNELPELETFDDQRRLYPRDGFAAHLIGYVGELSAEDLNSAKFAFYEPGDVVGKSGVEETYDEIAARHGRLARRDRGQPRQGGWSARAAAGRSGQGPAAHHRPRRAARGGAGHGGPYRRAGGDGPAQRRDSGDGLAANVRPQPVLRAPDARTTGRRSSTTPTTR